MRFLPIVLSLALAACGVEGPPGPPGPQGPQGPSGSPGLSLATITECASPLVRAGSFQLQLFHARYDFTDGSVMAYCEVADGSRSIGSTILYRATETAAALAECSVNNDVEAGSYTGGTWRFRVQRGAASGSAVYVDTGSVSHGMTVPYNCQTL